MSSLYRLFTDSPARRDDFTAITSSEMFPLEYCKHRWLENVAVVRRATEMWPSICVYVQKVKSDKSYTIIKGATTDVTSRDGNVRDDCITSDSRIWTTGSQLVSIESFRPLYVYKV